MSNQIELGREALYPEHYDASLLQAISRSESRSAWLTLEEPLPFEGKDFWTAFELSWLNAKGLPQVAVAEFSVPVSSTNIVESKSFKYYLNSFNQTRFHSRDKVLAVLARDISAVCKAEVAVQMFSLAERNVSALMPEYDSLPGQCVDDLDVEVSAYLPDPELLVTQAKPVECEGLYSHLLKSNCPVTGQPDWATLWVEYSGARIDAESFLRYVVSYRNHQGFHESCVEHIFHDIQQQCSPSRLSVYARYTRRGGLDINPFRTNCARELPFRRLLRQ